MANGFPVGFSSVAAVARVGAAALPALATPVGLAVLAGLAGVAGLGLLYAYYRDQHGGLPLDVSVNFPPEMMDAHGDIFGPGIIETFPLELLPVTPGITHPAWGSWQNALAAQGWTVTDFNCGTDTYTSGPCITVQNATPCSVVGYTPCANLQGPSETSTFIGVWFMRPVTFRKIKGIATRPATDYGKPWFFGLTNQPGLTFGVRIPALSAEGLDTVANPIVARRPWDLPVRAPGQVRAPPVPFPVPGLRPAPVNPAFPLGAVPVPVPDVVPIAVPGVSVGVPAVPAIVLPLAPPFPARTIDAIFPNPSFPPKKGEKEAKPGTAKVGSVLKVIANQLTEFRDFVQALWKALPKEKRQCKKRCTLQQMVADLGRNIDYMGANEEFAKEALVQLIVNEIEDNFFGAVGKKFRDAANELRKQGLWGDVAGFQTGQAYRPRARQTETPFDLEANVRRLVDLIW